MEILWSIKISQNTFHVINGIVTNMCAHYQKSKPQRRILLVTEKGNRWCPWFAAWSASDHPNWTSPLTCRSTSGPRRRLSCKQFQLDQNPGRHFIQPWRLHNSVGSPEVLLCIDMEKILHRRKCHISYQCLQAHVSHLKDMSQIYKQCDICECELSLKCSWFDKDSDFFTFPSLLVKGTNGELLDWRFFLGGVFSPLLLSLHHLPLN